MTKISSSQLRTLYQASDIATVWNEGQNLPVIDHPQHGSISPNKYRAMYGGKPCLYCGLKMAHGNYVNIDRYLDLWEGFSTWPKSVRLFSPALTGSIMMEKKALEWQAIPLLRKQNGFLHDLTDAIASVNSFCHSPGEQSLEALSGNQYKLSYYKNLVVVFVIRKKSCDQLCWCRRQSLRIQEF